MRIAITGAGGFIGSALTRALLADPGLSELVALDLVLPDFTDSRVRPVRGSLPDADLVDELFAKPFDVVFHLAALASGAVARDYEAGWRANFQASHDLLTRLARQKIPARFVFASSIAVFGVPLPDKVDDNTLPLPTLSYGAQKLMIETLVEDYARRGLIDGRAPRLPGIVARPRVKGGHLSAYLSDIMRALAEGDHFVCPVSAASRSWMMSRQRCVENLLLAARLPTEALGTRRAFTLPALRISMAELVEALALRFGSNRRGLVSYAPDAALEAQFGAYPPLATEEADRLGFRHDGDVGALIARALDANPLPLIERSAP